ncbi:MAG TPA: hypothetical protein VHP83_05715 [Aggregatilineaceae bacterium]|nr:hypothetical protein [Aggregatilineaceae bacterium]
MKHRIVRLCILAVWLLLALLIVAPALAQDGGGDTPSPQGEAQSDSAPKDLDDIAVKLTPLLVGAALIERAIEFLFNWAERAVLDATHYLHGIASRATGLVQVDLKTAWKNLNKLRTAVLTRQMQADSLQPTDPDSSKMEHWPLELLEARLIDAQRLFAEAQDSVKTAMDSKVYILRKKMAAGWISMLLGVILGFSAHLRLFQPLGVSVDADIFDTIDIVMAGVLMGLGTEWVHQVIGLLIQGKGLLGRAAGGSDTVDLEQVRALTTLAVQAALREQADKLKDQATETAQNLIQPPT